MAIGAASTAIYATGKGWAIVIPPQAWAGGLGAALLIGAIAGLLPAPRAARMSPTEAFNQGLPPLNVIPASCPGPTAAGHQKPSLGSALQCIVQQGYTLWARYQSGSRFWPFQWIEGGWLLALSVLLIAATIWLVRRRAT